MSNGDAKWKCCLPPTSSTGGFGTGGGRAGAIVTLVLGLIGMNLGGLALARSRRSRCAN